jgi:short-subunit dehydrogenase
MGKTALITGASSGIGYDLCPLFAADNYDLVIVARSESKLQEMAIALSQKYKIRVTPIAIDLSQADSADKLYAEIKNRSLVINILVNNAGFGLLGEFVAADYRRLSEMMSLNIVTLTRLTRLLLPDMVNRKSGKIMNVASTAGFQPGPLMAVYYASKAYVVSFSQALSNELAGSGVTVTTLCPGPTATKFEEVAGVNNTLLFNKYSMMSSPKVAIIGYRGLRKGKRLVIPGFRNKLLAFAVRFMPRKFLLNFVRSIQEKRK